VIDLYSTTVAIIVSLTTAVAVEVTVAVRVVSGTETVSWFDATLASALVAVAGTMVKVKLVMPVLVEC
jgi:hypothetical protein